MELDGRTALVTGASRNIGQAIAVRLAEAGANVGISARSNEEGCIETANRVKETGSNAATALGDLANPDDIDQVVESIRKDLGPIDILVNNATATPASPFQDVSQEELEFVANVNFRGIFLTTQHVVSDMLEQEDGAIVNITGALVHLGAHDHVHSFGSKMAIEGMTRQLATELGPNGIRVNTVSPGLIDVDREHSERFEEIKREIMESTPLRRTGTVEEIADAVKFLLSKESSFVTGQTLHVNGGTYPIPNLVTSDW